MSKKTIEELFNYKGAKISGNSITLDFEPKDAVDPEPPEQSPLELHLWSEKDQGFFWHAPKNDIKDISWVLSPQFGGASYRSGKKKNVSSTLVEIANYSDLINGIYTLSFEGRTFDDSLTAVVVEDVVVTKGVDAVVPQPTLEFQPKFVSFDRQKGLTIQFHGTHVYLITAKMGASVDDTSVKPTSSTVSFPELKSLSAGDWTIKLVASAIDADGIDHGDHPEGSVSFTVTDAPVDPIEPTDPIEPGEPSTEHGLIQSTDTAYINFTYRPHPSGKGNIFSDISGYPAGDGYNHWWSFDNQPWIKQKELKDYHYLGEGIVSVTKLTMEEGLDTFNKWKSPETYYYRPNAGKVVGNSPHPKRQHGGQCFILVSHDGHTVPDWKTPTTAPEWSVKAPQMKLPEGKLMTFHARASAEQKTAYPVARKAAGETHFNTWGVWPSVPESEMADHTIGMHHFGVTGPRDASFQCDLTFDQFVRAGEGWPARGVVFMETAEASGNQCWIPSTGWKIQGMLTGRKNRFVREGRFDSSFVGGCYGEVEYHGLSAQAAVWNNKVSQFKEFYSIGKDAIRQRVEVFANHGDLVNTMNAKYYGSTCESPGALLDLIFRLEVSKLAGYKAVGYTSNGLEVIGSDAFFGPYYGFEHKLKDGGKVITHHLPRPSWLEMFNAAFLSMWFGDGFYLWDAGDYGGTNKEFPSNWGFDPKDMQGSYLVGTSTIPPSAPNEDGVPAITMHTYDAHYQGAEYYNRFRETEGGNRRYVSHTFGGKYYQAESDGSDALMAFANKNGVAQIREKDGKKTLMYLNPFLGNETKVLKVSGFKDHEITGNKVYCFRD